MSINVGMISLGCSKNQVDAEVMLGILEKEPDMNIVKTEEDADVLVVNTCGFIDAAKEEAIEAILTAAQQKKSGRLKGLIVTGCMAQRYRDEVRKNLPEVDVVLGIGCNGKIAEAVRTAAKGGTLCDFDGDFGALMRGDRLLTTPSHWAYLKIAEGCDNRCTYCAIPDIRGPFRSKPMSELLDEAAVLAQRGVRELIVVAQDTTRYGTDLYGRYALPELLKRLSEIDGLEWIRFHYAYPESFTDDLIETFASNKKILNYFDIPIQHVSDRILSSMNRRGSKEDLYKLFYDIRSRIPDACLRTTVIVGFPGERESDFSELTDFAREIRFDRLGVFAYSREEGTPAASFKGQIPKKIKLARQESLMRLQNQIMQEIGEAKIGKALVVLTDGFDKEKGLWYGRSYADSPGIDGQVYFRSEKPCLQGQFVKVTIERADGADLYGGATEA